ncbi:RbsD/FucU domain-containing protein [Marispirochaeta sp.]|jgi:L-fucose mutarotase|uniref:RbsD/FucU family protein n=1 Tax=Marispirochaeta sp. TaxID=2038653 RepID=UPI0029C76429|nr:RbsD/FucU domain-containing protein [Marispirochaeta sp.]
MLKGIPKILPPELLKILMEMGHGDELVIGDGNFPHASCARRLVRCDGHNTPELLQAVLELLPLDTFVEKPAGLLEVVPGDNTRPKRWDEFRSIVGNAHPEFKEFEYIERFEFYERAKKAYAVVATGDQALYACIILKKGVLPGE